MAGGATRSPYQRAHSAGVSGRSLPPGIAAQADTDPNIDAAHDAGRNGVPWDQFAQTLPGGPGQTPVSPGPSPKKKSGGIRRTGRTTAPTVLNPTGNRLPIGTGASFSIAGVFFGAIAYALALSVADYGPTGPLLWFKAKFLNEAAPAPTSK
jgi:hypothetical protein